MMKISKVVLNWIIHANKFLTLCTLSETFINLIKNTTHNTRKQKLKNKEIQERKKKKNDENFEM